MLSSANIRQLFLDFFASKNHHIVPSAPIVIKDDPTLLFTNAGMNQFKEYFLGYKKPPFPRIADTQKCLRVSGKHNDLEEVGVDTYHHTMFEMLGNWSFGNYFKKEAIAWAWELLTEIYKIDKERLYVTIFEGDASEQLEEDNASFEEWKKWISPNRILRGSKKDNFWEMGDTGPCGPCTEIHIDCRNNEERKAIDGKTLINANHPQVIEVWNLVFIQYNRLQNGQLEALPSYHVDTGMGFERLVRILQNKQSNYDTDLFTGIIAATEQITKTTYDGSNTKTAIAFRVIADHIRAIAFTIADGQLPSNTGAGYVIRRILRRAVRYYFSYLHYTKPLLHLLIPVLAEQFKNVFPEVHQQIDFIVKVVKEEEESFLRTLERGLKRMSEIIAHTPKTQKINGKDAFELYDTYGFPPDLSNLIAQEQGYEIDEAAFEAEMQQQKNRSRSATALQAGDWVILKENASSEFVGYNILETKTELLQYRKVNSKGKQIYQYVLQTTPFYAESGGQVGDTGILIFDGESIPVIDTKKENDLILHFAEKLPANIHGSVIAKVNSEKRKQTAAHHTATHLLQAALRKVLGNHVVQKGSLVNSDHLRFDFSHFSKLTEEEIEKTESMVNNTIRENLPLTIQFLPKEEALQLGAMALFGEKYGSTVRVVSIGKDVSIELCGGTHAQATGELGFFKIVSESAVAAGVRRIEAVSGKAAEIFINKQLGILNNIKQTLKQPKDIEKSVQILIENQAVLQQEKEALEERLIQYLTKELLQSHVRTVFNIKLISALVELPSANALKKLCFNIKRELPHSIVFLGTIIDSKPQIALAIDEEIAKKQQWNASKIIKEQLAPVIKGGGGGQAFFATAGGQDASQLAKLMNNPPFLSAVDSKV